MSDYADKLRSLHFANPAKRKPKTTVDVHDHHVVEVTEHWHDRQDVTVRPDVTTLRKRDADG